MYRNEHTEKYYSVPINCAEATVDPNTGFYTGWLLKSTDPSSLLCFNEHRHETLEIIYLTDGILTIETDSGELVMKSGDIYVASPFARHGGTYRYSDGYMHYCSAQIELSFFSPAFGGPLKEAIDSLLSGTSMFVEVVHPTDEGHDEIAMLVLRMFDSWTLSRTGKSNADDDSQQMSDAYRTLAILCGRFISDVAPNLTVPRDLRFIRLVTAYLNEHYAEHLTTSSVAAALSYNLNHFCRLFRANFEVPFTKYLVEYRLSKTLYEYRNTYMPPSEIAFAVGFRDYNYFAQAFKKYTGSTPTAFFNAKR